MFKWQTAQLLHSEEIAPNTRHFWLKALETERIDFRAGQFITLELPISERRRERWRSYSLVNPPNADNILELCVVRNPEGAGTAFLFDKMKVGDTVPFKGPDGAFFLPKKINTDLAFICTGTGIAPFRSMIFDIFAQKKAHQNIHLIFGTRHESNILYRRELEDLAQQHADFQYDIVLSKTPDWSGYQGYVHQVYREKYAKPNENIRFYLCGWANMIDEAVACLTEEMGYEKRQVITELYG